MPALIDECARRGVGMYSIAAHAAATLPQAGLLVGYGLTDPDAIKRGIALAQRGVSRGRGAGTETAPTLSTSRVRADCTNATTRRRSRFHSARSGISIGAGAAPSAIFFALNHRTTPGVMQRAASVLAALDLDYQVVFRDGPDQLGVGGSRERPARRRRHQALWPVLAQFHGQSRLRLRGATLRAPP